MTVRVENPDASYGPYAYRGLEWGRAAVKFIRQLVRNGNSTQVTMPRDLLLFLRWQTGDGVVVELTERGSIEIRRVTPNDMTTERVPSMTLDRSLRAKVG